MGILEYTSFLSYSSYLYVVLLYDIILQHKVISYSLLFVKKRSNSWNKHIRNRFWWREYTFHRISKQRRIFFRLSIYLTRLKYKYGSNLAFEYFSCDPHIHTTKWSVTEKYSFWKQYIHKKNYLNEGCIDPNNILNSFFFGRSNTERYRIYLTLSELNNVRNVNVVECSCILQYKI